MPQLKNYLSLVAFAHTVFALPFALVGFALGCKVAGFSFFTLACVLVCMVLVRSAAMAFNRYIDRDIDARNPRTASREIPAGVIPARRALLLTILCCVAFIVTTYFINPLCFALSPVALIVVLGYSLTKRFTALCHVVLGVGLSLAPIGAYMAVTGEGNWRVWLLSAVVMCWVSGFDILYALQDEEFDRSQHLSSVPVWLGRVGAMRFSELLHVVCATLLIVFAYESFGNGLGWLNVIGVAVFLGMLLYQHLIVKPNDLTRIDRAFFTTNGIASIVFGSLALLSLVVGV